MTLAKLPLPLTRFIVMNKRREPLFEIIPATTPKQGRVIEDVWNLPGGDQLHTDELIAMCKKRGWLWKIGERSKLTAANLVNRANRRSPPQSGVL